MTGAAARALKLKDRRLLKRPTLNGNCDSIFRSSFSKRSAHLVKWMQA
jgi:hypothetical protein